MSFLYHANGTISICKDKRALQIRQAQENTIINNKLKKVTDTNEVFSGSDYKFTRDQYWLVSLNETMYQRKKQAAQATHVVEMWENYNNKKNNNAPDHVFPETCDPSSMHKKRDPFRKSISDIEAMPYAISTVARKVTRLNLIAKFMRVKGLTVPILAAELETAALLLIDEEYVDCPSYYFQVSSIMKEDNLIIDPDNLKISGDRVFKAYDKSQMAKATPLTENLAFHNNDDTNLLLWWFLIGCRVDTLQCIEEAHVQEKHGYTEIYLTKEKVFLHGGRKIKLGCNCDATHQNEYCFRHNSNRTRPDLPIPAQRIKEVLKRYGLSGHSCRRGLALSIAWTIAREGRLIPIMDVLRHFGWANVSEQFENYSNDFLAFSRARWFPCEAVLSIFTNSSGGFVKLRSMPNLKQIKDNETDDGCKLPFTATLEQSSEARLQANDLALPVHT